MRRPGPSRCITAQLEDETNHRAHALEAHGYRMLTDPIFYLLAIPAVMLMGLAKGGFAGVGGLALPLLALRISPVQAAAILLPVLVVQDAVGVWAFRRNWDGEILALMIPSAIVGIVAAYLLAAKVSSTAVLATVGAISIVFAGYRLWLSRGGRVPVSSNAPRALGVVLGIASGFTSQVAHAGQPPFQMWVLPRGLTPPVLVGTTAIFFATVNTLKIPAYLALGQFTHENLIVAAALTPLAIASTLVGVWLVRRVDAERFMLIIYALMIVVGVDLLFKAVG
jgi:uncharacterized membrane protein YfcA